MELPEVKDFDFVLVKRDHSSRARAGLMRTPHSEIPTPVFIPVGTQATVKAVSPRELRELGATLILANAYHLYLRPSADTIADSGGFQIFSLAGLREVGNGGVVFRSPLDDSQYLFTPEKAIDVQEKLGADIIMCLDECMPNPAD